MANEYLALKVMMMPRDTNGIPVTANDNPFGPRLTIFGGVILSYIDQAGAVGARREVVQAGGALPVVVTVAVNRVEFKQPVLVGDLVSFTTRLVRLGTTSITIHVRVEAERGGELLHVTDAELVYVGIDPDQRRPRPLLTAAPAAPK